MTGRLEGKVALITGSGKGIGAGIAETFAKEGAKVIIADIDLDSAEKTAKKIGSNAITVKCDVTKAKDAENAVALAVKKFSKLDILVNNAGIFPMKSFKEMNDATWSKTMQVNIEGVRNCTTAAVKQLEKQGKGGKIINISSIAGIKGYANLTHYCTTKAGLLGFTRALALELAPLKINVNAICPGLIDTPGVRSGLNEKAIQQYSATIPLKRPGKPEDIAWGCVYLASEESSFITGQSIVIDGGQTA
ncbi:MAG: SDR family NAD(P)-dependent oxidoreductase [Candidatus Micrarchaeota archaeon]